MKNLTKYISNFNILFRTAFFYLKLIVAIEFNVDLRNESFKKSTLNTLNVTLNNNINNL